MASTAQHGVEPVTSTRAWLRLARAGAITMAVWSVLLQGMARQIIPPVLVIGLVFGVLAVFLVGERRRLGLVTAVFGVLALGGNVPIVIHDLSNPESAPTFILTTLSVVAVAVAVIGGVGAFLRLSTDPIGRIARVAPAVFVVASFLSVLAAASTDSDAALPGDVEVVARGIAWGSEVISVEEGVWIDNRDGVSHTFTVEELGLSVEVPAFKSRRVELEAAPGTYQLICDVPGHESMTATLVVEG